MVKNLFAVAAFAAMLPMGAAQGQPVVQSQEGIALENQILQLQQQVQQMQSGGNGGSSLGSAPAPAPASPSQGVAQDGSVVTQLLNQVNQLQSQVQQLNGEVDTLQNQVNTQHDATEKEIGDLNFKITNGGAPGAPGAPQNLSNGGPQMAPPPHAPAPAPTQNAAAAPAPTTPRATLHAAQAAFTRHDYATAEALSRSILSTAKTSPEAYQAQYLLAASLSGEGKSQEAAIAYDDSYNRNRTGPEAPQALLGLAVSLSEIHQNEAACDTLSSLNSQFPSPSPGMQSRIDAASHRAHCS